MPWFKVDDQLAFHAKSVMAGNSAMGLWVRAGSWSSAQLTDGFIPLHMANAMANPMAKPCDPDALVESGLWVDVEGGFQFHEWKDFQPSAEDEKAKRKARSLAGSKGAAARWGSKNDGKADSKPMANAMANECDRNAPTRPDPKEEAKASSVKIRDDVQRLCQVLADLIEANGSKRPKISKTWTDAARRMIDRDGRDVAKTENLIRWSQGNMFWRKNILSMPTFREKYDQLRLAALEDWEKNKTGPSPDGTLDPDAILGKDYWVPGTPPPDLTIQEEMAWKDERIKEHRAERLAEAQRRVVNE